jgi:iron(III) transport system permease protein
MVLRATGVAQRIDSAVWRSAAPGARPAVLRPETLVVGVAIVVIALLTVVPVGYLLWETFVPGGHLSLDLVRTAYSAPGLGRMVANTAWFAAGSTALAVGLGGTLAFLVVRTDVPARRLLFAAALAPLALPGVLYAVAWIFLASPRSGLLNLLLEPALGPETFDIFTLGGMIVVEGLHLSPLAFLLVAAALRSLDPTLEESAIVSGAGVLGTIRRVTLPLVRPAVSAAVLILTVRVIGTFAVPTLIGLPARVSVFTSRIWTSLDRYPPDFGEAAAYSTSLLALTSAGLVLHARLWRRGRSYQSITGKGFRPGRITLGRWRWAAAAFVAAYALVAAVLPLLALVHVSTQRFFTAPSRESFSRATLDAYGNVLRDGRIAHAAQNSILLGLGSATGVILLGAVASWLVLRTNVRGRRVLDTLAFLPLAFPGLVLAVAVLFVYLRVPLPVYGTLWILLVAYLTVFLPYGMRYASVSMAQVGRELEESAQTSGVAWWQTFRRIMLPLALPGLAAGWLFVMIVSVRELSTSILLYSPGTEVLAVTIWEQYANGRFPEVAALGVLMVAGLTAVALVAYRLGARRGLLEA